MGLFANVPYAQAPGMGFECIFSLLTVVGGVGYGLDSLGKRLLWSSFVG